MDKFEDKVLLITGGTGSFGNAVLERFLDSGIKEIRIFSRDEKKQHDMRLKYSNPKLKFFLGDVRNFDSIFRAMQGVDYVFQAAALKQVPSCEFFPIEATMTNVIGTENVVKAAIANKVAKVICLSTDKAAYPINAMGMTKALMEKVAIAQARSLSTEDTTICVTRYGNVMASRGSVIPLFVSQLKKGEDLTITDPKMTRYLMSLEDAVDLVLFAFENGRNGDLFVQKAPASTIQVLAEALMDLFPSKSGIKVIGTRHGEKVFETLCTREEMIKAEDLGGFYRVPADNRGLNYEKYFEEGLDYTQITDYNSHNTHRLDIEGTKNLLMSIEYIQNQLEKKS
jgi:UDP-N-acetylglucosamine 4,6-dehydratase/5-epimerase